MARDFDGLTDRIDYANVFDPNSGPSNLTLSAWVYPDTGQVDDGTLLDMHNSGDTDDGVRFLLWDAVNGSVEIQRNEVTTPTEQRRDGVGGLTEGSWQHVFCETDSGAQETGMETWVDNAIPADETENAGSGGLIAATGTWSIGNRVFNDTKSWDGRICEVGVWDRLLIADERNALAKGFSPLHFRRGLRFYTKLIGRKDIDIISGKTPTYDGSAVIEHPRIIYPG